MPAGGAPGPRQQRATVGNRPFHIVGGRLVPAVTDCDLPHLTMTIAHTTRRHLPAQVRCGVHIPMEPFAERAFDRKWTPRVVEERGRVRQSHRRVIARAALRRATSVRPDCTADRQQRGARLNGGRQTRLNIHSGVSEPLFRAGSLMQSRVLTHDTRARGLAPCAHCIVAEQCPVLMHHRQVVGSPTPTPVPELFPRRSLLQREGELALRLAFVKQGLMTIRKAGPDGVSHAIAVIGPGHLLGQSASFALPSVFTVQAATPVAVCHFPARLLRELAPPQAGTPGLALRHRRMVVQTLADWSCLARLPGLTQRFETALRLLAALQPARPLLVPGQGVLAELLGVTRESINRAWHEAEARGIVRHRRGQTVDLDLQRLGGPHPAPG